MRISQRVSRVMSTPQSTDQPAAHMVHPILASGR